MVQSHASRKRGHPEQHGGRRHGDRARGSGADGEMGSVEERGVRRQCSSLLADNCPFPESTATVCLVCVCVRVCVCVCVCVCVWCERERERDLSLGGRGVDAEKELCQSWLRGDCLSQ